MDLFEFNCQKILEQLRDGLVIARHNPTQVFFVNPAMERITGHSLDELFSATSEQIANWIHPLDRAAFFKRWDDRLAGKDVPERFRLRTIRKDGSLAVVSVSSAVIECNGTRATLSLFRDITEQVMAKEALQQSEEQLQAFFNASTEIALLLDSHCTILATNKALAKRHGKTAPGLVGTNACDLVPGHIAEQRKAYLKQVIRSGKSLGFEDEWHGRYMYHSLYPVFDKHGKVTQVAVYARDVTEEKRTQEALKRREAALKKRTHELEEVNTALRVLLKQRVEDKAHLEQALVANVKQISKPYIEKLKATRLDDQQKEYLKIIESNLNDIVSPFAERLAEKYSCLTPAELQTVHLVKEGKTTKEIAQLLHVSCLTVESRRKEIRKKLGIQNRKTNLRSHLMTI